MIKAYYHLIKGSNDNDNMALSCHVMSSSSLVGAGGGLAVGAGGGTAVGASGGLAVGAGGGTAVGASRGTAVGASRGTEIVAGAGVGAEEAVFFALSLWLAVCSAISAVVIDLWLALP